MSAWHWPGDKSVVDHIVTRAGNRRHLAIHAGTVTDELYFTGCGMLLSASAVYETKKQLELCHVCAIAERTSPVSGTESEGAEQA